MRDFLRRELTAEGYRVETARNDREVSSMVHDSQEPPDLLILDPEIPYLNGEILLERLRNQNPLLPVVIHTFLTEYEGLSSDRDTVVFVKKTGNTDTLKTTVNQVLYRFYRNRFIHGENGLQEAEDQHDAE